MIGLFSPELLLPGAYGRLSVELACNWAIAQGYRYLLFSQRLTVGSAAYVWSKPRALLLAMERYAEECSSLLLLDADAVVMRPHTDLRHLISSHLHGGTHVLAACARLGGSDACHGCRCTLASAGCTTEERLEELDRLPECQLNSGVILVRNGEPAREMIRWWARAGGPASRGGGEQADTRGQHLPLCPWEGTLPEQDCANLMVVAWAERVRVVSALQLNTPAWWSGHVDGVQRIGGFHASRFERVCGHMSDGTGWKLLSLRSQLACFNSSAFICHAMGLLSVQRGRLSLKREAFTNVLQEKMLQVQPTLRSLLMRRGDVYRDFQSEPAH